MIEKMRYVNLRGATGELRTAEYEGREWYVLPVVALVEGVIHAVNSKKPELVRAEKFSRNASAWAGRPVFSGHPMEAGVPVSGNLPHVLPTSAGLVFTPRAAKKLEMEAWLDPERCKTGKNARLLARAKEGKPIEVSVGAFVTLEEKSGDWSGRAYDGEWDVIIPDHLALLDEGQRGACSLAMGCGALRANSVNGDVVEPIEEELPVAEMKTLARLGAFIRSLMPRGWGDDEVKQEISEALAAVEPQMARGNGQIVRVTNDYVVYCIYPPPQTWDSPMGYNAKVTHWKRPITFDAAAKTYSVGEAVETYPTTVYEDQPRAAADGTVPETTETGPTIKAACADGCNHDTPCSHCAEQGEANMIEKKDRIAALVANPHNPLKVLKALEACTDDELKALEDAAVAAKKMGDDLKVAQDAAAAAKTIADNAAAALKAAQEAPITEERLPAEVKLIVANARAAEQKEKDGLVTKLKAAQTVLSEDVLKTKSLDDLRAMASLAKIDVPRADFSLQGMPVERAAAAGAYDYTPPDPYAKKQTTVQ